MAEVTWIKVATDLFENPKVKMLRRLPEGDKIALFWIVLLTIAGRCNSNGMIFITKDIPYDTYSLADDFKFPEETVEAALNAFVELNMIAVENGFISICGWGEHQNIDGLDKIREQNRKRVEKHRQKQKEDDCNVTGNVTSNVTGNVTVTLCNGTEKIRKEKKEDKKENIDYIQIKDLFHTLCPSFPRISVLSEKRKQAIKARLNTYSVEQFEMMFRKAEASSFLKGQNNRNWQANFDWLIKDSNFAKVLDGNYDDKGSNAGNTGNDSNNLYGGDYI